MAELDERVDNLERWAASQDEELSRLRRLLASIGVVASQADRPVD
jgi:hypothetical protein